MKVDSNVFIPNSCPDKQFIGISCNISTKPCDRENLCQNDGTCVENISIPTGYSCNCTENFRGMHCETPVGQCEKNKCLNSGSKIQYFNRI